MNKSKLKIVIMIFLGLLLFIPKVYGDCEYRKINEISLWLQMIGSVDVFMVI